MDSVGEGEVIGVGMTQRGFISLGDGRLLGEHGIDLR